MLRISRPWFIRFRFLNHKVKSNEQENRLELYQKTVDVLGPRVAKLKDFFKFQNRSIDRFVQEVRTLAHPERLKGFISQTTKITLAKMLDMFAVLDALKNMKACLNNDFSFWKRWADYVVEMFSFLFLLI